MAKQVDLKDLDVYYGDFLAVEGVTLTIPPRAVTAFIGPSGCGKSTVLRTLNRLHELVPGGRVEGHVLLDGEDIYAPHVDPIWVRQAVGMVFQRPNPFPAMPVRENVVAGFLLRAGRHDRSFLDQVAEETLRETHLWDEVADRLDDRGQASRAGSSSACASLGRSRPGRTSCSWTNRARRSTRSPRRRSRTSSRSSSRATRSSSSPTTWRRPPG